MDIFYKRKLSEINQTQRSISKSNIEAQKKKVSFLKLYEKKKMKLMNKNKMQNKTMADEQRRKELVKSVKEQRIMDELQMTAIKQ